MHIRMDSRNLHYLNKFIVCQRHFSLFFSFFSIKNYLKQLKRQGRGGMGWIPHQETWIISSILKTVPFRLGDKNLFPASIALVLLHYVPLINNTICLKRSFFLNLDYLLHFVQHFYPAFKVMNTMELRFCKSGIFLPREESYNRREGADSFFNAKHMFSLHASWCLHISNNS